MINNDIFRKWYKDGLEFDPKYMLIILDIDTLKERPVYIRQCESAIDVIRYYQEDHRSLVVDLFSYAQDFELQLLDKQRERYE